MIENSEKLIVLPTSDLSHRIIGAAMKVHSFLGPGLLEATYEACLEYQLKSEGIKVRRQVPLPVYYYGIEVECGYRIDLIVEDSILLEIKAVEKIIPIHEAQLLTYLKLSHQWSGLLINFNVKHLREGIRRLLRKHE